MLSPFWRGYVVFSPSLFGFCLYFVFIGSSSLLSQAGSEANTATTANIYPTEARGDVVNDEGDVEEVATTATTFNRVPWLAS